MSLCRDVPVERLFLAFGNNQNAMKVIGHHDKFVQENILPDGSGSPPFFFHDQSGW